jgi:ABC-type antimicrobial peptide transport system permease subunit
VIRFIVVSGQIAWKALGRNRLRSGLTTLGVVIGVAAVIAMVALGNGARASVERTLKSAGTNVVQVSAGNFIKGGESMNIASGLGAATTLTRADADAIRALANVENVSAGLRSRTFLTASPQSKVFTIVHGVEASLGDIHGWTWIEGEGFTAADVQASAPKVVLGRITSARLFGDGTDPTGRTATIHGRDFEVVGVMRAVDPDQDEAAFVPVTLLGQLTNRTDHLQTITIGVSEAGVATAVADAVTALLRQRHAPAIAEANARAKSSLGGLQAPGSGNSRLGPADDFTVKTLAGAEVTKGLYTEVAAFALANMPKLDTATMEEMSGTLNRAGTTMTALLASIAGISLVVGGIGIMNIMLVSVTERTREIGLRLAMGARRRDVMVQFLVEAVVLSLLGGIVGIGAGIVAARGLTALMSWPTYVSPQAIAVAFAISALVGVAFGYYPARRASRLDPIVALRRE